MLNNLSFSDDAFSLSSIPQNVEIEKGDWFNSKIRDAIDTLNADGVTMMGIPEATRKQALKLESQIDDAANKGDKSEFIDLLSKWKGCFQKEPLKIIMCPYKGIPREIYTSVCLWHRQENDPECFKQKCSRVALKK